jgi:hypothetical protein
MTLRIMGFNMRELSRVPESRVVPIQVPQPLMDIGVTGSDVSDVGLEVLDVDGVEADDSGEEADIGFGDRGAVVEWAGGGREVLFYPVEGAEELGYGFGVGFFCCCEAGAVDAVVDIGVGPFVRGFDFFLEL